MLKKAPSTTWWQAWLIKPKQIKVGPGKVVTKTNDSINGLAADVWTKDIGKAHRIAAQLRTGTVWINGHNIFDAMLPFDGNKQSGWKGKWIMNPSTCIQKFSQFALGCKRIKLQSGILTAEELRTLNKMVAQQRWKILLTFYVPFRR